MGKLVLVCLECCGRNDLEEYKPGNHLKTLRALLNYDVICMFTWSRLGNNVLFRHFGQLARRDGASIAGSGRMQTVLRISMCECVSGISGVVQVLMYEKWLLDVRWDHVKFRRSRKGEDKFECEFFFE